MTGPKHLWSGDWRTESADLTAEPAESVVAPPDPPPPVQRPLLPTWRLILPAAVVVLAVAVALVELLPGSRATGVGREATTPSASAIPNPLPPTPNSSPTGGSPATSLTGRTVNWLGMQISTVQNVGAVIQTVRLGSPADAAGLDPGDIIQTVNRRTILAAAQIRYAVSHLRTGQAVDISVDRGSTQFSTVAAFAGQPTTSP
ncbi:MAG TPA: PDZ domain-containing protein [Solirubrobacteraceae bacterium]|nr:PDZ domain-containing protein [Solirubrobacteraceae bacterium]